MFHYNTGIRRRRMELLESFLVLFPIKVPWNQAYNSGVSLAPGYQWPVTSFFFGIKLAFAICFLGLFSLYFLLNWFPVFSNRVSWNAHELITVGWPIVMGADTEMNQSNFKIARAKHGKTLINKLCFLMNSDWLRKGRRSLFSQSKRVAIWTVHTFNRFTFFFKFIFFLYSSFLQIDCTTEGKKCTEHKIHAFPSLKLFKDGREVCCGVSILKLRVL